MNAFSAVVVGSNGVKSVFGIWKVEGVSITRSLADAQVKLLNYVLWQEVGFGNNEISYFE